MPAQRLTENSDERPIANLLGHNNIFAIPYFQRPYKWTAKKLKALEQDIIALADDEDLLHFLGASIIYVRPSNPADASVNEIIDGQQRFTTLFIYIAAAINALALNERPEEAVRHFRRFMVLPDEETAPSNISLHSSRADRASMNRMVQELASQAEIAQRLIGLAVRPLTFGSDTQSDRIWKNYGRAKRFFRDQIADGGIDRVQAILEAILGRLTMVTIEVKDPLSGPKIFNSLNSAQEPMTVGDLVRNDVFARSAGAGDLAHLELLDGHHWNPFYSAFGSPKTRNFDEYFFPFGLINDPNVKKPDVYASLRKSWDRRNLTSEEVIASLSEFQKEFLDLREGTNKCELPEAEALCLRRFWRMRAPSSIFPYLMRVTSAFRHDEIDAESFKEVLLTVDSLLVRRAVRKYEPTGLHAAFKRLWDGPSSANAQFILDRFASKHSTITWPNDADFEQSIKEYHLYGARVTPYFLAEYDRSLEGDIPDDNRFWIEHVLPQKQTSSWESFSPAEHREMCDTLANLLPLSAKMNLTLSNGPYSRKRPALLTQSMYMSARAFAETNEEWNPEKLRARASLLSTWALERWPYAP